MSVAAGPPVNIYLFWTKCYPHCALEKEFLAKLASRDQQIEVVTFELSESRDNRELFRKVGEELRANVSGVPFTVVGERYVIGWLDEDSTGALIVQAVAEACRTKAVNVVARLRAWSTPVVAMVTLQLLGVGTRYKQASNLIGGVLMLILGILLIFRPETLRFG